MTSARSLREELANQPDERWYLRIDGHNYGPVPRAEFENFLRPPRLCTVMEVKCGDGVWFTICRHETLEKVLAKVGIEFEPTSEAVRQPMAPSRISSPVAWLRDFFEGLVAWLLHHWIATVIVVTYLAVNAYFLFDLRDPHAREREILARYEELWKQAQAFGADESSGEAWRRFADPARAELKTMLRELERSASIHRPIRQNLLVAGREHFLRILLAENFPARESDDSRLFARRLDLAHEQLSADDRSDGSMPLKANSGRMP